MLPIRFDPPASIRWHGIQAAPRSSSTVPKRIWTYWDTAPFPKLVEACMHTWRQSNGDYTLNVLTQATLHRYLPALPANFSAWVPAHCSDWVRLAVLEQHGGVWIDSTSLVFSSLDFLSALQQTDGTELVAYYSGQRTDNPAYPMMENWLLAAVEKSTFMQRWRQAFERLIDLDEAAYAEALTMPADDLLQGFSHNSRYFAMHAAAQLLMREPEPLTLSLIAAEADAFRPAYVRNWDIEAIADWLCEQHASSLDFRIFKMPGPVWRPIEERLQACRVAPASIIGQVLTASLAEDAGARSQGRRPEAEGGSR